MQRYNLICIGSGPAGEKAATQAAYFGQRVAVIEREPRPGGAMVNTGTIASKSLRETALLRSSLRRRPLPGTDLAIDDDLSVARFMARRYLVQFQEHDRIELSFDRHGIDVYHGTASIVDPHTIRVQYDDGRCEQLGGDNILIATGSAPHHPDFLDFSHPAIVDADGVLQLEELPRSIAIIGGGVIGCEYACIFAEMDIEVTLIDPHADILPFVDTECRDLLLRQMQAQGVRFKLGTELVHVEVIADAVHLALKPDELHTTDIMLWAAGRHGNTEDLGLEQLGIQPTARGHLEVDDCYRTSVPSIYAAGDVIGFPALASTSMEQGRIAACRMFDIPFKQKLSSALPFGLYTIPAVSLVGLQEQQAIDDGRDVIVGRTSYRNNARGRMLGDEQGLLKCVFDRATRQLLGAAIIGEQATELIHLAQMTIVQGEGIDYFISACFNYPSLTELYKYAAYNALQQLAREDEEHRRVA